MEARVIFVNGFHRSGTTVTTSAVTEAIGGVTTTVGSLADHIPALSAFLHDASTSADRGVDRLPVTHDTSEEYGFLLNQQLGTRALYGHPDGVRLLRAHIADLASRSPGAAIVLKNPWDVGRESQILADFPEAVIILVRRRVADIERSLAHALQRSSSSAYARALEPDTDGHRRYQQQLRSPVRRELLLQAYRMALRRRIYRLTKSVPALPIDRVALVSYDEFLSDPIAAAGWVGHIVDPRALALAFTRRAFSAPTRSAPSSALQRTLDRRWKTSWDLARSAQARAGILPAPWAVTGRRTRRRSPGSSRYRPITSTRATSHEPPRLTVSSEEAPS